MNTAPCRAIYSAPKNAPTVRAVNGYLGRLGEALLQGAAVGGAGGVLVGGGIEGAGAMRRLRALGHAELVFDEGLGARAVVSGVGGRGKKVVLRYGPEVRDGDLEAHLETVAALVRGESLLGRIEARMAGWRKVPPGSVGAEARAEVSKLRAMIAARRETLAQEALSPETAKVVQGELDVAEANLEHFLGRVHETGLGVREVAQPGAPPGYPEPPEGHYYRRKPGEVEAWEVQRYPGSTAEPKELWWDAERNAWAFRDRVGVEEGVRFAAGTTQEAVLEMLLSPSSRSTFKPYAEMLERYGIATRKELLAALPEVGGSVEQEVVHDLKKRFRERVVGRMFAREGQELSEAESIETMREMLGRLESSDRGTLAEQWYERYQASFRGNRLLEAHPRLTRPGREGWRVPDFAEGNTVVEVKSSRQGLSQRDLEQIEDALASTHDRNAILAAGDEVRRPKKVRVVFTEIEGARGAMGKLGSWFESYEKELAVEVFVAGKSHTAATFDELRALLRFGS